MRHTAPHRMSPLKASAVCICSIAFCASCTALPRRADTVDRHHEVSTLCSSFTPSARTVRKAGLRDIIGESAAHGCSLKVAEPSRRVDGAQSTREMQCFSSAPRLAAASATHRKECLCHRHRLLCLAGAHGARRNTPFSQRMLKSVVLRGGGCGGLRWGCSLVRTLGLPLFILPNLQ